MACAPLGSYTSALTFYPPCVACRKRETCACKTALTAGERSCLPQPIGCTALACCPPGGLARAVQLGCARNTPNLPSPPPFTCRLAKPFRVEEFARVRQEMNMPHYFCGSRLITPVFVHVALCTLPA